MHTATGIAVFKLALSKFSPMIVVKTERVLNEQTIRGARPNELRRLEKNMTKVRFSLEEAQKRTNRSFDSRANPRRTESGA